ncbi:imidazole glycerol phosphate synthase subunit HisH [Candidatus Gracilibacteria bacterium]|nr:imidazole glycerol phosphate synthase subunit HisH [Candidatus Gracilibacteria bacterium]
MIAVINYGAGNLPNVVRALRHVGADLVITEDPAIVAAAPAVVLPGVGATADTMRSLNELGLSAVLPTVIAAGRPFLGICVGMQVLLTASTEFGHHACLDIVGGTVERLPDGQKVPQIGWNQVRYTTAMAEHPLFYDIPNNSDFYFVHSYYCALHDSSLIAATTSYGLDFPSILVRDNLAAVQFHPEKSGALGLQLLRNFVTITQQQLVAGEQMAWN